MPASATQSPDRPKVLFIAVDDLRPLLGCYGVVEARTPHLDALSKQSVVFHRAYCQQAICNPSRASLMTGARPDTIGVHDLETHFRDKVPDITTVAQHFKQQGYHARSLGKIYHGTLNDPESWSEPWWKPKAPSFYFREENRRRHAERQAAARQADSNTTFTLGATWERAPVGDVDLPDGKVAERAMASLAELRDQPFFLGVGFVKPHLPFVVPEPYYEWYDGAGLSAFPPAEAPRGMPACALNEWEELNQYDGLPHNGPLSPEMAAALVQGYFAAVSYLDAQVGKVLAELDRLDLRKETVICFWADHGFQLGEHGQWCKHNNFEASTRVPLMISAPGIHPRAIHQVVELLDVFPTLCELADLAMPSHLEGKSLRPLMEGESEDETAVALSQYPRQIPRVGPAMGRSIRTSRYRYTAWQAKGDDFLAEELYDYQEDPGETVNLAGLPLGEAILDGELRARHDQVWGVAGN